MRAGPVWASALTPALDGCQCGAMDREAYRAYVGPGPSAEALAAGFEAYETQCSRGRHVRTTPMPIFV